jgi:hypothetical protein
MMHPETLWILWLRASQSVDNGIHGLHGRKHLRPQYGSTVCCFFLAMFNNSVHGYPNSRQLLEELCLIHERGVVHGDLRVPNIILQNGSDAHFIDFSHGYKYQCTGHATCLELMEAHQFLLTTTHLV